MKRIIFLSLIIIGSISSLYCQISDTLKTGTLIDGRDGHEYKWVKIGDQVWMAENLAATEFNDSTAIPNVKDNTKWGDLWSPAYCWYDNDSIRYSGTYGALYNWYAASSDKLCPAGWHVPLESEWKALRDYIKSNKEFYSEAILGDKSAISLASKFYWNDKYFNGTTKNTAFPEYRNITGFNALPSGERDEDGRFSDISLFALWWCANKRFAMHGYYCQLRIMDLYLFNNTGLKRNGFAVRCVMDDQ